MSFLKLKWSAHNFCNFLYNLNIERERTKSVDLNSKRKWLEPIGYFCLGISGYIFTK